MLAQDQQQSRCERQVESNPPPLLSLPINSPAFTRKIAARWVTDPARNGKFLQKGAARSNRFLLRVRAKKCYPYPTCPSQKYSFLWMKTCPKIHVSEHSNPPASPQNSLSSMCASVRLAVTPHHVIGAVTSHD